MAKKNVRNMKVCGQSGYKYETVPAITLKGKWLEELGFHLGDYVQVKCENCQLRVIVLCTISIYSHRGGGIYGGRVWCKTLFKR